MQAKWYYYVLLGMVDVEANFLGMYLTTHILEMYLIILSELISFCFIILNWTGILQLVES